MITTVTNPGPSSWNLAMPIFVGKRKSENPEKISSKQEQEPITLKRKAHIKAYFGQVFPSLRLTHVTCLIYW